MKDTLAGILLCVVFLVALPVVSCVTGNQRDVRLWEDHEPTSVTEDIPIMVTRAYYKTDEDFNDAVQYTLNKLESTGRVVYKVCYKYGNNMTMKRVIKFACIYYEGEKNE